jgi:hypothetical protein
MTLPQRQHAFALAVAQLLGWLDAHGYTVSLGEAWRPPETAELYARQGRGIANSLHCDRLAIDLTLRFGGTLLTRSEQYAEAGRYWETLHPTARWGGRFADGGHFSFGWGGRM